MRTLSWFSCGAASAVATKLTPDAEPVYCETGAEHPDNERFFADCEAWFDRKITRLKSDKYEDTWDVWTKRRYLAGVEGALCTVELKAAPRLAYQKPTDVHVLGYTADQEDVNRAQRLRATYPEQTYVMPLIDRGLTKQHCLEMVQRAGIALPPLYALGFDLGVHGRTPRMRGSYSCNDCTHFAVALLRAIGSSRSRYITTRHASTVASQGRKSHDG